MLTYPRLHLDKETRSARELSDKSSKSVGLYRYAVDPTTSVWMFAYRFEYEPGKWGPVKTWWRDQPLPAEVIDHIARGGTVVAHNAGFERIIWHSVMPGQSGLHDLLPLMTIEQMDCTMARARALGLPGDLARVAQIVEATYQKDLTGGSAMLQMAKPRNMTFSNEKAGLAYHAGELVMTLDDGLEWSRYQVGADSADVMTIQWWYDDERRQILTDYCVTDVLAECGVDQVVLALSPMERQVWELDQRINDRGVKIDAELCQRLIEIVDIVLKRANQRLWTLTGGAVKKCSEHTKLRDWLNKRGIECESVGKGATEELLALSRTRQDPVAEEAIALHNGASKSSTSKFKKALRVIGADDRARGEFMYHGATPGRWTGRGIQLQNLVRVDEESELPTVRTIVDIVLTFAAEDAVELLSAPAIVGGKSLLFWLSKCVRPMLLADQMETSLTPRGPTIYRGADLSNIEGRMNAWISGEQWKLDAFVAADNKTGPGIYELTAAKILGVLIEQVTKMQRQAQGKVPELACGYQGSVGAFVNMAANYGTRPEDVADIAAQSATPEQWAMTLDRYRPQFSAGLERHIWTGIKIVVDDWRRTNSNIVKNWWDMQDAAIEAVSAPGAIVSTCGGKINYMASNGFLWCRLSSGRLMAYPQAKLVRIKKMREKRRVMPDGTIVIEDIEEWHNAAEVWGLEKGQWRPYTLYGGLQCQNICEGNSRDILATAMLKADALNYPLVLHAHDELLAECPVNFGSIDELVNLLSQPLPWTGGLPLHAKAWQDERYVK